ncbi:YdcF family protein [uncultured Alsobacter sp.]|uniref:YdcF family protein n=1 Tax=uncultured Alsobacter sp. TaxID=1748258 RepID=UPI0025F6333F|nr:YdcF family protein [uncultured Alsobacter sp.]
MERLLRLARNLLLTGALLGALVLGGGFLLFVDMLDRVEGSESRPVDGIVALTGGAERVSDALDLLVHGRGNRLLITGVNEKTTREELVRQRPDSKAAFACCVDLDYRALNTVGNAEQTRVWARRNGFKSLLVVTSSYHMPRTLAEIGHVLPDVQLVPHPVVPESLDIDRWWRAPQTAKLLGFEYVKFVVAMARMRLKPRAGDENLARASEAATLRRM